MSENVSRTSSSTITRRYLALWFPYLATDRLHLQRIRSNGAKLDERPLVVVEKVRGALLLTAADQQAAKLGLSRGLTLADARARVPDLAIAEADAASDNRFVEALAERCSRFTPSVGLDRPDGIILDITGCAHLFGGEPPLQELILNSLRNVGLSLRSSIAGTPDAARAFVRFGKTRISPHGKDETLVKRLPVAALAGIERETVVALLRAGLKTIGDLSERPPQILAARFGQGLLTSLMRTLGREDARITPLRPLPPVVVDRHFPEPFTQMQAIEGVLVSLLDDVAGIMQSRDEGGRVFEARFFRSDGAVREVAIQTGRPSRDAKAILRLFLERLGTLADPLDPGFGFDCIRLAVPVTEGLKAAQPHLDGNTLDQTAAEAHAFGNLVDQLAVRFGRDCVLRFEARNTHDPDHDARLVPAADPHSGGQHAVWSSQERGEPPRRPLQLFARPQPIEAVAEVPDGPPLRFRWRRVLYDVARAEGPERIEPEWWRKSQDAEARDYYRVEDRDGSRFWIFRQGHYGQSGARPRWFLHGVFA